MAKLSDESQSNDSNSSEEEQVNDQINEEEDDEELEAVARTAADEDDDDVGDAGDDHDEDENEVKFRSLCGFVLDLDFLCVFDLFVRVYMCLIVFWVMCACLCVLIV